jgi:hypothetical protein
MTKCHQEESHKDVLLITGTTGMKWSEGGVWERCSGNGYWLLKWSLNPEQTSFGEGK